MKTLVILQIFFILSLSTSTRKIQKNEKVGGVNYPPVQLYDHKGHVVMTNGFVNVTISTPDGMITGVVYEGAELLEQYFKEDGRGYWDVVWSSPNNPNRPQYEKLSGSRHAIIHEDEEQVEVSFLKEWDSSQTGLPLNIDKRYIMLRGCRGFYSYSIFERLEGWPDFDLSEGRIAFKLQPSLFEYMAISDERQRIMPTSEDRKTSQRLAYDEAVVLTNPKISSLKGEVDDKYQYSSDNKDSRVHGWMSSDRRTGFWVITPTNEFKTGGPLKQDLTSHAGPIALSVFFSNHYGGRSLDLQFRGGEAWKKVFGPILVYLNSAPAAGEGPRALWDDAKAQMARETERWPYDFPASEDFPGAAERGGVSGRLLVRDSYMNEGLMSASSAYIGLAPPGDHGSWERESKGYQFWTRCDAMGAFTIANVRVGTYSLYAWVPNFIGDYKYSSQIKIKPGSKIRLGDLVYRPPRNGPTLWEIGIPDRTAAEFYVPDPNPSLVNKLYTSQEKFRQYGLWDRYTDLYPNQDLVYTVESSHFQRDWYFAHVNRKKGNKTYIPTTWEVVFNLKNVERSANYTLQLALAAANYAELQVRINDESAETPYFTTKLIGKDNAIARHGIHGLYLLYSVGIEGSSLVSGRNVIYLTQSRVSSPWNGIMYDYIRLEGPSSNMQR